MIYSIIQSRKNAWVQSLECPVKPLLDYMRQQGQLRDAQMEAIETYLFLKIVGDNKPLATLFSEGFLFDRPGNLDNMRISMAARQRLQSDPAAWSLFQLARLPQNGKILLPQLEQTISEDPNSIRYEEVFRKIFYNITYPDYLFSLPMGAGKTFLIAALIYLDLYFAQQNPQDIKFAHNFLVLIPSGLKSSIAPSLKTIEQFDPSWVLPEPAASNLKRLIHFEILDEAKSAKGSNRARNPNAQKVSMHISQPDPMGLVFLVNAEKVILDRLELGAQLELIEKNEDEKSRAANELRHLIGKIPNLCIHIDEVHHATDTEIKLRQVVTAWNQRGNVTTVLGYSGTPYLTGSEKIAANDTVEMQFRQITNTVYYYPLAQAIRRFLKKPAIKTTKGLSPQEIIRRGVTEFYETYGNTRYSDGTIAKLAIYCGNIERLEEEIYPFLRNVLQIPAEEILKYHKGNAKYKISQDANLEFAALDLPISQKRIILLVQIGKEGWDCRSLTSVILAQKNDSPKNMVLQTTCRCLRQVEKGKIESALIWLNDENANTLQNQLKDEQQTSIEEINALVKDPGLKTVTRYDRTAYLQLPSVDFYQLRIDYGAVTLETAAQPERHLAELRDNLSPYRNYAQVQSGALSGTTATQLTVAETSIIDDVGDEDARFDRWLTQIARESFGGVAYRDLAAHHEPLQAIFTQITTARQGRRLFNLLYDQERIRAMVRAAFYPRRQLETNEEVINQNARLLLAANLGAAIDKNLYPSHNDVQAILQGDQHGKTGEQLAVDVDQIRQLANNPLLANLLPTLPEDISIAVRSKERTLHYLPYSFAQSKLEKDFLEACLTLDVFKQNSLEIYYNGERGLTEFVIRCYQQKNSSWQHLGEYTPDFLILERGDNGVTQRVLIVETKGKGFEGAFAGRRQFVENTFLRLNQEKFGYARFDFIYIRESDTPEARLAQLTAKINHFFGAKIESFHAA